MAKVFGRPGEYSHDRNKRMVMFKLNAVVMTIGVYAFLVGYFLGRVRSPWILLAVALSLAGMSLLTRIVQPWWDQTEKERKKFLRGAQGEAMIGWLLEDLPDDWYVFHGLQLQSGGDLDHIAVGPGGVYYISTKNLRGLISTDSAGRVVYNTKPTDLVQRTLRQAMALRERLVAILGADVYVNAVLAVPFAWIDLKGPHNKVWVLHKDNLLQALENGPKRLTEKQVKAYVTAVEMIAASARKVRDLAKDADLPPLAAAREEAKQDSV